MTHSLQEYVLMEFQIETKIQLELVFLKLAYLAKVSANSPGSS